MELNGLVCKNCIIHDIINKIRIIHYMLKFNRFPVIRQIINSHKNLFKLF